MTNAPNLITIEDVIGTVLMAVYSHDILNKNLYLKGGQALRFTQGIKSRLSVDVDFSTPGKIQDDDIFFNYLEEALRVEFRKKELYVIDFKPIRKPKKKTEGDPDFWGGWEINFKLITKEFRDSPIDQRGSKAIVPKGAVTNKIPIEISEYEYCGSIDIVKLNHVEVKTYSKTLLTLEKLRAICQSHPSYHLQKKRSNRARDFYDIERLYNSVLQSENLDLFISDCIKHALKVFEAKEVPIELLNEALNDLEFISTIENSWSEVTKSTSDVTQPFSYYLETIKNISKDILDEIKTEDDNRR